MIFLYIAAALCVGMSAAALVLVVLGLRRFRKWRGMVMRRLTDLDAMIAALPSVLDDSREEAEERDARAQKNGTDITNAVMSLWQYSMKDAYNAARGSREVGDE